MIALVRANGHAVFVNPDLLETAERDDERGMTLVVLTTGNSLVVTDSPSAIAEKVVAFRARCRGGELGGRAHDKR